MAKVLDIVNDLIFVRLTLTEYEKINRIGLFNNDEEIFDEAVKSDEVKTKLSLLSSKL
ncbi:MAG: hypothetical protein PHE25_02785 [Candidatus Gracilibacteria bacterium]|nr:hypothetical protein [Candidatus Gracilibacteria bacterium]